MSVNAKITGDALFTPPVRIDWCTPDTGVILWGESSPYLNPVIMCPYLTKVFAEGKGVVAMWGLKEA